jgi:hypothetical protein
MLEGLIPESREREFKKKIDFRQVFRAKLESIAPLSEQESKWESPDFQSLGIKKIKRKIPAVIFRKYFEGNMQLWITDHRNTTELNYIHDDVRVELRKFLEANNLNPEISLNASSAYIIQDDKDKLYLFFDGVVAEGRKDDVDFGYDCGIESLKKYEKLMKRYGIEKMMGQFNKIKIEGNTTSYGWKMENILDKDIIGRIRENEYLVSFAKKYKMTNSQFMRFRIRAIAGREAVLLTEKEIVKRGFRYLVNLDDLAKEVIVQDKEDGHL